MDEVLRRRLVGATVLLLAAWLLAALLPEPGPVTARSGAHVVTYDLRTGQPLDLPPVARKASSQVSPRPEPPMPPATSLAPAEPARTEPATQPKPEPAPQVKPTGPVQQARAAPAPLPHPALKVDESFGAIPAGAWYVQIGSFESQANARSVLQKLYGAQLPALIQTVPQGHRLWYRVRVGPYRAEDGAQKALVTVKQRGYPTAKLVRPDTGPATGRN